MACGGIRGGIIVLVVYYYLKLRCEKEECEIKENLMKCSACKVIIIAFIYCHMSTMYP